MPRTWVFCVDSPMGISSGEAEAGFSIRNYFFIGLEIKI